MTSEPLEVRVWAIFDYWAAYLGGEKILKLNPKGGRGGQSVPFDFWLAATGSCYGHKNSWLYPYKSQVEGSKVIFFTIFTDFSEI